MNDCMALYATLSLYHSLVLVSLILIKDLIFPFCHLLLSHFFIRPLDLRNGTQTFLS